TSRARPSAPTSAPSPTGRPTRWVRARHRGAHLKGRQAARQRGRPKSPSDLRFSSSVTRTHPHSRTGARSDPDDLTFIRRAKQKRKQGVGPIQSVVLTERKPRDDPSRAGVVGGGVGVGLVL